MPEQKKRILRSRISWHMVSLKSNVACATILSPWEFRSRQGEKGEKISEKWASSFWFAILGDKNLFLQ